MLRISATVEPWRRARRSGRPARTCRSEVQVGDVAPGWFRSVMTRASSAAAGDVPGVRALDLVADPHAAGAEDAAVVVDAEPLVADVDVDSPGSLVVEAHVVHADVRRPGPAARSGRWPRRPSRRGCARRRAARRSSAGTRASRSVCGLDLHALGDRGHAGRQQPVRAARPRPGRAGRRRRREARRGGTASGCRCRPRAAPRGSSGPSRAVTSLPSIVSVLTGHDHLLAGSSTSSPGCWADGDLAGSVTTRPAGRGAGRPPAGHVPVADEGLVLVAEVAQRAQHRVRGRLAQAAQAGVLDHVAQPLRAGRGRPCSPCPSAIRVSSRCICTVPARQGMHLPHDSSMQNSMKYRATSTMLVVSSMTIMPPEPMIEPSCGERLVVDRRVEQVGRDAAAGGAAGLHRLDRAAVGDAAADVLDDLPQRRPHRHLDQAGVAHLAGQREDLRALALLGADARRTSRRRCG